MASCVVGVQFVAGAVLRALHLDGLAPTAQQAHPGVAQDGIAQVDDMGCFVGSAIGVFN
ncbi:MAG TPA: hypothetical protein VNE83_07425 [Terriglobales bacterium]|nr:hypothetical protein [Terriglobales bacterium]